MSFFSNISEMLLKGSDVSDSYDDYEDEEDDYVEPKASEPRTEEVKPKPVEKKRVEQNSTRRINMSDGSVRVFKPIAFDEAKDIVDALLAKETVLMNFENTDIHVSQRVLDIVAGACMAVDGNLQRISNYIFIATPDTVDVSGDFQDSLLGTFDALQS